MRICTPNLKKMSKGDGSLPYGGYKAKLYLNEITSLTEVQPQTSTERNTEIALGAFVVASSCMASRYLTDSNSSPNHLEKIQPR